MGLFDKIFKKKEPAKPWFPEEDYTVTITETYIRVEHPEKKTGQIMWDNIEEIKFINTDEGPWLPDVWLALSGKEDGCLIPQGAKGYEDVYNIVSKYESFNFENVINSMTCTDNAEFPLWTKK